MLWPHTCSLMTWCMKELTFYSFRWIQHLGVNGSIVQRMILTQLEALAVWMMCDAASYPVLPWQTSVGCQMTAALPDLERKGRNVSSINRLSPRSLLEWGRLSRLCITRLTLTVTISRPAVIHFVLHFIHSDDTGYACCAIDYPPMLVWLTHVFIGLEFHVVLGLNLLILKQQVGFVAQKMPTGRLQTLWFQSKPVPFSCESSSLTTLGSCPLSYLFCEVVLGFIESDESLEIR